MTTTDGTNIQGPNAWLLDEMRARFEANPAAVSAAWRAYFRNEAVASATAAGTAPGTTVSNGGESADPARPIVQWPRPAATAPLPPLTAEPVAVASAHPAATAPPAAAPTVAAPPPEVEEVGEAIRGAGARIVKNMEASLDVPTATSFRDVPARLLEVNRKIINGYLGRTLGGKVSFTHLIGYAVVRAIADHMPAMNATFVEDSQGNPRIVRHEHVGLGLAVDVENPDGTRTLLVPCIRDADTLSFKEFHETYEQLIAKVRNKKLSPDDFVGTTVTLTNPGTLGTRQSVPRLMPGQGLIVGVGALDYPAAFEAVDPNTIARLGLSKVLTISSTYDHRIIQGAESGTFLKNVHDLLLGEHGFYEKVFEDLGVPYAAVQWRVDTSPDDNSETALLEKQMAVNTVINMHRVLGHKIADLDPLRWKKQLTLPEELDPATYGLTIWDLEREFLTSIRNGVYAPVAGKRKMELGDLLGVLRDAYCRTVGIEYMHIQKPAEKRWIQEQVEGADQTLSTDEQLHILGRLNAAEALEKFLATKYVGQKRFGIEGAESTIPLLDAIAEAAANEAMDSVVIGMAHRGRLNVLINVIGKKRGDLFEEFEGYVDPDSIQGSGDVKYHLGQQGTFTARSGARIPIELAANPSHLEAVDPVVVGMARARMDQIEPPGNYPVLPVLIHGDAAFAGQGVVAETLNLSNIRGYRVGGTIHLIIDNQVGFTTTPDSARSSEYSTDVAKMVQAPILHVNGDDPEACVRVARLAFRYRQQFHKDVVIDMVCYRRHGHNEGDDPSYTLPTMYRKIDARPSVRALYTESLVKRGDISLDDANLALADFEEQLQRALDETRESAPPPDTLAKPAPPARGVLPTVETGVDKDKLEHIYGRLAAVPDGFVIHPKLARQLGTRDGMFAAGEVDWALAETFALGSLLLEGTSIRLTGQDSRRGTFSQRHSVLVDYDTSDEFVPLMHLSEDQGTCWIYDSLLSEYAALGFEYGYSVKNPEALVIWEAQFGDFANGAQIIIDQFIVSAEDKWDQRSGLVLLLPHGFEGQGPEHSSGRMERFLLLCADDNIQIVNATTAAQYFHLLRRQMRREVWKPLVVFTPKSLLRAKETRSPLTELTQGHFHEVLDDPSAHPGRITRVVFTTGKIAHQALLARDEAGAPVAVVRVEQLFPWPFEQVAAVLKRYSDAHEIIWLQEEPENMGAWNSIKGRLYERHGDTHTIRRVSRPESGSPATGVAAIHAQEQEALLKAALNTSDLPAEAPLSR